MSEKKTNNQEMIEVEAEVEETASSETETQETGVATTPAEEKKTPLYQRKGFKIFAAAAAGAGAVLAVGAKIISSFGEKKWDDGYNHGFDDGMDEGWTQWGTPAEPEPEDPDEDQESEDE